MDQYLMINLLTSLGTIFLGLVGLIAAFKYQILSFFIKPNIDISINMEPPDCIKTVWPVFEVGSGLRIMDAPAYFIRFEVLNKGSQDAEGLEVFASQLLKKGDDGQFKKTDSFESMRLAWSHINIPYLGSLPSNSRRHCDLGYIIKPQIRTSTSYSTREFKYENLEYSLSDKILLHLRVESMSDYKSYLIKDGIYRLLIEISGKNVKLVKKIFEIEISGPWYEDPKEMFTKGIKVKFI